MIGIVDSIDSSLLEHPLSSVLKSAISVALWGASQDGVQHQHLSIPHLTLSDAYWAYYSRECKRALHDSGRHVAVRTHRDVIHCSNFIKADAQRKDIKVALRSKFTTAHADEDQMLDNSIDLAASLLLMTSFSSHPYGFSGHTQLRWSNSDSRLRDFVHDYFDPSAAQITSKEGVKLERIFTVTNLCRIAGLEIVWTDNLVDHLRLSDDDSRVHVFHHASFLDIQKQSPNSLLPQGLADETLRTLALLLPSDAATRAWVTKQIAFKGRLLDPQILHCGRLMTDNRQIEHFKYWGDRLVTLKQVFDEARPRTLAQWWHDRRNGVQWYTFWVAVAVLLLTVFFGLVQSIEGAMQVYVSFRALNESHEIAKVG